VPDIGCSTNAAVAFDFLVGKGLSLAQAAGVVGNLQFESGLDPALAVMDTNNKMSRGIAMWQPDRWQKLLSFADGRNPLSLDVQLEFLWSELQTNGLSDLRTATQPQDAAVIFQNQFERPAAAYAHTDRRIALAQTAFYALPQCTPPRTSSKIGIAAGVVVLVAATSYGVFKWLSSRPEPALEPEPEPRFPPMIPGPIYRRRVP